VARLAHYNGARLVVGGDLIVVNHVENSFLRQDLKEASFSVVPIKPEYDKKIRMSIQSAKFESGRVLLPKQAPWLADLELELFAFPRGRHDDQVDSISQALGYNRAPGWTAESLDGFGRFVNMLYQDAMFGRLAGRPW
jgi:hypothetical protein